jgi:hypothetical protein
VAFLGRVQDPPTRADNLRCDVAAVIEVRVDDSTCQELPDRKRSKLLWQDPRRDPERSGKRSLTLNPKAARNPLLIIGKLENCCL